MTLDGTIANPTVTIVVLVVAVLVGNLLEMRWNPQPESVFTPEAIRFHKRRWRFAFIFPALSVVGWLTLDLLW